MHINFIHYHCFHSTMFPHNRLPKKEVDTFCKGVNFFDDWLFSVILSLLIGTQVSRLLISL